MKTDTYADLIAAMPCIVCGSHPVQLHHAHGGSLKGRGLKGMGLKTDDSTLLSLCARHHTGDEGIHTLGVLTFEHRFGTQADMLIAVAVRLESVKLPQATRAKERVRKLSKILPRRA